MILQLNKGRGAKSLIQCDNCGATHERFTSKINKSQRHFCNRKCKTSYTGVSNYSDAESRRERQRERKDAKLKKKDMAKKRCMKCGRIYDGPPGDFSKNRDKDKPEPGVCEVCSKSTFCDEWDYGGIMVRI